MREYVSKAFNPSKMFLVLKSELIKKKGMKKKGGGPDIGTVFIQAVPFIRCNSEDRLLGVVAL